MSKPCLLLCSLWFAASCSLYDESLLPAYELGSSSERNGAQRDSTNIEELTPHRPSLSSAAAVGEAGSGRGESGHEGSDQNSADTTTGTSLAGGAAATAAGSGGRSADRSTGGSGGADPRAAAGAGGNATAGSGGAGTAGKAAAGSGGAGSAGKAAAGSGGAGSAGKAAAGSGGADGSASNLNCPESDGQTWSSNGHCYFPLTTPASWNVSRDNCNVKNAKLVTITSLEEQSFVAGLLGSTPSWIGLSKFGAPQFSWITSEALDYTNWASGEPNQSGEAAVAIRNDTHNWFDDAVSTNHPAICERP